MNFQPYTLVGLDAVVEEEHEDDVSGIGWDENGGEDALGRHQVARQEEGEGECSEAGEH